MISLRVSCVVLLSALALVAAIGHDDDDHTHAPTLPGKCPEFPAFATLDVSKLNGDWFGISCLKKGFDDDHDHDVKCVRETISAKPDGSFETQIFMSVDGKNKTEKCIAKPVQGKPAQFSVEKAGKEDQGKEITITVVDTDNSNYLICAGCISDGQNHGYGVHVFSRSKTAPPAAVEKAKDLLKKLNINDELEPIDQSC